MAAPYGYDEKTGKRLKTAEIIGSEAERGRPPPPLPEGTLVEVRVARSEVDLRQRVKWAGGRWNPAKRAWHLPHRQAAGLYLRHRTFGI